MDEVERAQTMLLGLEREKVWFKNFYLISKLIVNFMFYCLMLDLFKFFACSPFFLYWWNIIVLLFMLHIIYCFSYNNLLLLSWKWETDPNI
jgi:hypothetical protein